MGQEVYISTKYSDLDGDFKCEKITLMGVVDDEYKQYMNSLKLIIEYENKKHIFNIDIQGYEFDLFLGDFLKTKKDQILITGLYGGTGGYAVFRLYEYKNDKLKLILDDERLSKQLTCSAKYFDNYKLSILCKDINKSYIIDISGNFKGYLDIVYDKNGKLSKNQYPIISQPNTIYPIKTSYNDYYSLQIQQRINGVSNADILGGIQNVLDISDKGKVSIKEQYFLLMDRNNI